MVLKKHHLAVVVAHMFNPSTCEAEADRPLSKSWRQAAWSTEWVPGQPELSLRKTLSQNPPCKIRQTEQHFAAAFHQSIWCEQLSYQTTKCTNGLGNQLSCRKQVGMAGSSHQPSMWHAMDITVSLFFSFSFLKIYLFFMYMVFWLHASKGTKSHYRWLWATMWWLGTDWTQDLWKSNQCS